MPRRGLLNINKKQKQKQHKEEKDEDIEVVAQSEPVGADSSSMVTEQKPVEEDVGVERNNKIILEKNIFPTTDVAPIIQKIDIAVLKKKKSLQRMEAERKAIKLKKKMAKQDQPKKMRFLSAEKIIYSSRIIEKEKKRFEILKERDSAIKHFPFDSSDQRLILAVRIKGVRGLPQEIRRILMILRLPHTSSASFLKNTPKTQQLLKYAEHFVTWGYPTLKTVRDIVTKRGYTKDKKGARIALSDNRVIEGRLGQFNIVCLEDIVNEIWSCGNNFLVVLRFLASFHMNPLVGGYRKKRTFSSGGDCGPRGDAINQLIEKIN